MIGDYTKSEICSLYRQAKDKKLQIEILTQLTGLSKFKIEQILEEGGYLMTDLVKDRILQLHKQGLSDKAIGRELNVSQSQVSPFLRSQGLPPNGRKFPTKKEEDIEVEVKQDLNEVKTVQPDVKHIEKLRVETQKNVDELKTILPQSIPKPEDLPIEYDIVEELSPQQFYELARLSLELLKTIWG